MTDRDILRAVGRRIQAARLAANITQECLAELIGIHWQTISGIERGRYPCSLTTFIRITQHLGVSADSLLDGVQPPDSRRSQTVRRALIRKRKPKADYLAKAAKPARG